MRRPTFVVLALAAAVLTAGGCSSSSQQTTRITECRTVSLSGGDSVGRKIFRDSPEFAIACSTPRNADIANVETDSDGQ